MNNYPLYYQPHSQFHLAILLSKKSSLSLTLIMSTQTIFILVLIGIVAGILSGFVGVGGGILIVPALVYFLGMSQHEAQGTSLFVLLLPVGIFAVINYSKSGYMDWKFGLIESICVIVFIGISVDYVSHFSHMF